MTSIIHELFYLLADHCTYKDGGREKFVAKVNMVLEGATLDSSKDIDALWRHTWDKPLYADQYAFKASNLIDALRANAPCLLDDYRSLPVDPDLLKGLKRYTLKHQRVLALASAWEEIYRKHIAAAKEIEDRLRNRPSQEVVAFARHTMGAPGYPYGGEGCSYFDSITSVKGFGEITALHISTDLGYPVYKPDRWLLRFAAVDPSVRDAIQAKLPADKTIEWVDQSYLNRHLHLVLHAVDHLNEEFQNYPQPPEIISLDRGFRRHRFVDLMVVKFGMTPEQQFGIEFSPKDVLLRDDKLALKHPSLYKIACDMDQLVRSKRIRSQQKAQATRAAKALTKK